MREVELTPSQAGDNLICLTSVGATTLTALVDPYFLAPTGQDMLRSWLRCHGYAGLMLTNRSAPPVTVTPVLTYPDVRAAVAWLQDAFGFEERVRVGEDHRAQLRIGDDGAMIVADAQNRRMAPVGEGVTHEIKVRVPDVDEALARAVAAGARVVSDPHTWEYGERSAVVKDLAGHHWELTQTVRDVGPEEWGGVTVASW